MAGASDRVTVDDKPTFEEWFLNDEFSSENVTVKSFIHNLIKKTDFVLKNIDLGIYLEPLYI